MAKRGAERGGACGDLLSRQKHAVPLEKGIVLKDHICCPAIIEVQDTHTALVTITEGKYHQIKRMFGCFGAKVLELHRITMGNLNLPADIPEGCCREITEQEMKLLMESEEI